MVVKILSSSSSFAGIHYNERKSDKGTGMLLSAQNFGALGHGEGEATKADYVNYLKMIAALNPRVKNKQFHAIISTQGREHSPEELKQIAEQYLKKMGYGENPYLIYSHSDTANNHVHIVSTRVTKQGNKVDDSFERIHSQKAIQEIMGQHPEQDVQNIVESSLAYSFSTLSQFALLLENHGYQMREKSNQLEIIKHGRVQQILPKETVDQKINQYQKSEAKARIRQLSTIFHKYKSRMDITSFVPFIREKFGVDIVLHQKKEHAVPYGYTVIDHAQHYVFKGGEIMKLAQLLNTVPEAEKLKELKEQAEQSIEEGYNAFTKKAKILGFKANHLGQISRSGRGRPAMPPIGEEEPIYVLENELLKKLKYHDRSREASNYQTSTDAGRDALARLFFIRPESITSERNKEKIALECKVTKDKFQAIAQYQDINTGLENLKLTVVKHSNNYYIIDQDSKVLFTYSEVGNPRISLHHAEAHDLDNIYNQMNKSLVKEERVMRGYNTLASILMAISNDPGKEQQVSQQKKRKRRRR